MKLSNLAPNKHNPRKITEEKLEMIKKSLIEFGDLSGIVFNRKTNRLVGGHQRLKVLPSDSEIIINERFDPITRTGTIAKGTIVIDGEPFIYREVLWDETKEKAANIAANKHGGEWDLPQLSEWMLELDHLNYPLDLTGFDDKELTDLLAPIHGDQGQCDEDEIPEVKKEEIRTTPGDLYMLGKHRLLCGDSTKKCDVLRLMNNEKALLMVTDPPYGINLDMTWRDGVCNTNNSNRNKIQNDDRSDWFDAWKLAPIQIAYVWHDSVSADIVIESLRKAGFEIRQQIIWNKMLIIFSRSHYHWQHESCYYAIKEGCNANWLGDHKQTTVWDIESVNRPTHLSSNSKDDRTEHPTQKPVRLWEIPIHNHTIINDLLYDPFAGSGTAIIACEKTNRRCFSMELDPYYCDIIVARWEKYTGMKAKLSN